MSHYIIIYSFKDELKTKKVIDGEQVDLVYWLLFKVIKGIQLYALDSFLRLGELKRNVK